MLSNAALLTRVESQAADQAAIAAGTPAATLMENAARAVADFIMKLYAPCPVLVVCGSGKNGGDGKIVGQLLEAQSWTVKTISVDEFSPDMLENSPLVVDAIFGTGLNKPIADKTAEVITAINERRLQVVAVDIASGIDTDSGEVLGVAMQATHTITFVRAKPGQLLLPGKGYSGKLHVAEIGISGESIMPHHFINVPVSWQEFFPRLSADTHKYIRGHALVVGGGMATTGAARLAAIAALRCGAGLVSIACSPDALPIYAAALTAVMTRVFSSTGQLITMLEDHHITAHLIGPGCGISEATRLQTLQLLSHRRPCVIDADSISAFQSKPGVLFGAISGPTIMTPHEGEFMRLFSITGNKLQRAREAARQSGAIMVLKGSDTVIASPDGRITINANAPPYLATAGSGDVLAGMITGFLAQGIPAYEAACAAVWMHGAAAQQFGPGLIAEDLPLMIPGVLRGLING